MPLPHHPGNDAHAEWRRVHRGHLCPICNHDSWCTIAPDDSAVRCKRVESSKTLAGDDGPAWLHVLAEREHGPVRPRRTRVRVAPVARDFRPLAEQWQGQLSLPQATTFATSLGITVDALLNIGCGWTGTAFSFPMYDAHDHVVGVRLRCPRSGHKFAYPGSKEGVFLPATRRGGTLLLPEGATDTAACVQLEFDVVGRPSCSGGTRIVASLVKSRDVVVFLDRDKPGIRGGESLASAIAPYVSSLRVAVPPEPHKDLRDWLRAGLTSAELRSYIDAHLPRRLATFTWVKP